MAGMWRKLGGVFLEFESDGTTPVKKGPGAASAPPADPGSLAGEADDLLAQLEGRKAPRPRRGRPSGPPSTPAPAKTPPVAQADVLSMTPDGVYARAAIQDSANSADRILKMIAGLAAFPPEQQRAMIQALDAADPSWAESDVLEDARRRQSSLRSHLRAIEQEKSARVATLNARSKDMEETGLRNLNEIDKQLAELQQLRQQQVASTAAQVQKNEDESRSLEESGEAARREITDEINRLSGLMTFFTGTSPTAG